MEEPATEVTSTNESLLPFKRAYKASTIIFSIFGGTGVIGNLNSGVQIEVPVVIVIAIATMWLPFLLKGGFENRWKWAIWITTAMTLLFCLITCGAFWEFVETGGGEGPRGEGSPLANILAIALGALLFLCPWLLTAIRGIRCWKDRI